MKTSFKQIAFAVIGLFSYGHAQTLYVPGGSGSISGSTTNGIGIGTSAPRGNLEIFPVCSPGGTIPSLLVSKPGLACYTGSALGNYIETRAYSNPLNTAYTMPFVVTNSGRVGMNTSSPLERLHIDKGAIRLTGNNGNGGPMILFGGATDGNVSGAPSGQWGLEYTPAGMNFWRPNMAHNGSGTPIGTTNNVLFLSNSNRVSVNTGNALGMFHVENNVPYYVNTTAYFSSSASQGDYTDGIYYKYNGSANWHRAIAVYNSTGDDVFRVHTNGYTTIGHMATLPGLGASSSSLKYKLVVEKGILTERVKVALEGTADWADYVFDTGYKRNSIEYVEDYIKKNKHLPNVPSASDVYSNGLDVAEMDATLLRQIEELWLQMIELKKENEKMKDLIRQQQPNH